MTRLWGWLIDEGPPTTSLSCAISNAPWPSEPAGPGEASKATRARPHRTSAVRDFCPMPTCTDGHSQTETVWPVPASPGWAREPQENERAKAKDKELEGVAQLSMRLAWHGLVFWAASARVDRGKKRRGKREREPTGVCLPPTWSSPRGDPGLIRSIFASHRTSLRSPIPKPCFFVPLFF